MPSENTGNTIKKIKITKTKVIVTFDTGVKLEVSPDVYTSHYFYVDRVMSDKEISDLQGELKTSTALAYAKGLLAKAMYTEWTMRDKLYNKEYTKDIVDATIKQLKKDKLINDKAFIKEYIAYANAKLYGKNKIIHELKKKGIFDVTLQDVKFSEATELRKAKQLLPSLERQYAKLSTVDKKTHIYRHLINDGYSNEIANEVAKKAQVNKPKQDNEILVREFDIALNKALQSKTTLYGVQAYIYRSLSNKGFSLSAVKKLMEERNDEIISRL